MGIKSPLPLFFFQSIYIEVLSRVCMGQDTVSFAWLCEVVGEKIRFPISSICEDDTLVDGHHEMTPNMEKPKVKLFVNVDEY